MAEKVSAGQGITVFLYGESKNGGPAEVIRTELERSSWHEWVADWAVRPNMRKGLFDDAAPTNQVERRLGADKSPWHGLPLPAAQAVSRESALYDGATLVLFWLDRRTQAEEMVRFVAKECASAVF